MKKGIQNKWFKVIFIFILVYLLAQFFSWIVFDLVTFEDPFWFLVLFGLKFFVISLALFFLTIFIFKLNFYESLKMFGIKKEGLFRGFVIFLIVLLFVSLFGILFFLSGPNKLTELYQGSLGSYLTDFDSIIPFDSMFVFSFIVSIFVMGMLVFTEEFIFRCLMINLLSKDNDKKNLIIAVLVSSLLFSLWHFSYDFGFNILTFVEFFIMGIIFSLFFIFSKRNVFGVGLYHLILDLWWPAHIFRTVWSVIYTSF